jgi:hypothetical protein
MLRDYRTCISHRGGDVGSLSGFDVAVIKDHTISELWTVLTTPPA